MVRCSGLRKGPGILISDLPARELKFDKFKSGGPHEKHAVATWNLGIISAYA
jgi:hypothetical protein